MPRILVVDDDRAILELLEDTLGGAGYEVGTCRDGNQVVPMLEKKPYELLLLDVLIPHLNGFGVLEALRKDPAFKDLPVIMISGIYRARNHRKEMMERFHIIDYLNKPISPAKLVALVEKVVGPGARRPKPITLERRKSTTPDPVPLTRIKSRTAGKRTIGRGKPEEERLVEPEARQESRQVEVDSRVAFRTSAFLFQGSIKRNPVAALLGQLAYDGASGALLLRRAKVKKIVYVRDGNAYAVKSNLVSECLGQLLVRERLITEEECAASVDRMKETGQPQGEILVEMQSMTEKNLAFALELQLEAKLFEPFKWEDGEFRYNPTAKLPPPGAQLDWEKAALVIEGIRRSFDETRLRSLMIPVLDVPLTWRTDEVELNDLGLTKKELSAARKLELPQTARELISSPALPPTDMLRVLYSLIAVELLVP